MCFVSAIGTVYEVRFVLSATVPLFSLCFVLSYFDSRQKYLSHYTRLDMDGSCAQYAAADNHACFDIVVCRCKLNPLEHHYIQHVASINIQPPFFHFYSFARSVATCS